MASQQGPPSSTLPGFRSTWRYYTRQEIESNSPSAQDGVDSVTEKRWRRAYCSLIQDTGMKLKIPQWAIATAVEFCHRFFNVKSMIRNDRFIVATACLFLASKVEESPRPLVNVINAAVGVRYSKNQPQAKQVKEQIEEMKEQILTAERAILYTIGFNLNVSHPYKYLLEFTRELGLLNTPPSSPFRQLLQFTWNFVNDSLRTTLCLQHEPRSIAVAALYLASNVLNLTLPTQGVNTFDFFKVHADTITDIMNQILEMYEVTRYSVIQAEGG